MKKVYYYFMVIGLLAIMFSCKSPDSKAKYWTAEQEKTWKTECLELIKTKDISKGTAEDNCDCLFEKTAQKYTPEEAARLTTEQEQKIWDECAYSW